MRLMGKDHTQFLEREGAPRLAFRRTMGKTPTIIWCGGFRSDMTGTKAAALHDWAQQHGRSFIRFDYSGHGESDGNFTDGNISTWLHDALTFIAAEERPVLVGSSMGGWIALLAALRRSVSGLVLLAPAPDFTERLMWAQFSAQQRADIQAHGRLVVSSEYAPGDPTILTRDLIEDGRRHLILDRPIAIEAPVRIIHGQRDPDVPWPQSIELAERLSGPDVLVHLRKDGDHRLSRPQDIAFLVAAVANLVEGL
jgi:pimeloyl-ACP methyl ester carboxylesterase